MRFGPAVFQPQTLAQAPEAPGLVAGAIVGEHFGEAYAQAGVVANGLKQCQAGAPTRLVWVNAAEGQSRVVVDGDMNVLPSRATVLWPMLCASAIWR